MKKNNILNNELNKYREKMNKNTIAIMESIKDLEVTQLKLLDTLIESEREYERILGENLDTSFKDLIKTESYIEGEFIKLSTTFTPPSMFTFEINNNYTKHIYSLKYVLREKILEFNERWNSVLIVYKFHNKYKIFDLENYYFKPYTDAIVEAKVVKDDSSKYVSILYKGYSSSELKLEIEIYNEEKLSKEIKDIIT
ncbi:MAG: hypothetical protein RR620_08400 [Clostridium sp.]